MRFQTKAKVSAVKLPVPPTCDLPYFHAEIQTATLACHKALPCQRCGLCLHHCKCMKHSEPADKPAKQQESEQMTLCEKPTLQPVNKPTLRLVKKEQENV